MEGQNQDEDDEQDAPPPEEPPPSDPEEPSSPEEEEPPETTTTAPSPQPAAEEAPVGVSAKERPTSGGRDFDKLMMKSANAIDTLEKSVKKLVVKRKVESSASATPANAAPASAPCSEFLNKRSPFIHDPPQPEERRSRIANPRTPKDYIINLREDLADFQETHGLPRTRDYSFVSLGLALAQETARAVYSLVLMFTELFPIVAIISLIVRFALDKLIEILETTEPVPKLKKSVVFALEMLVIIIPLWILVGTIILPLITLVFSIFKRMFRLSGGRKRCARARANRQCNAIGFFF